jgi:hypothetical protein
MRWKDHLLLGSMLMKPLRGVLFNRKDEGESKGCALGMIGAACTGTDDYFGEFIRKVSSLCSELRCLPISSSRLLPCGCSWDEMIMGAGGVVGKWIPAQLITLTHLFNQHVCATDEEIKNGIEKWSLPQLADWLDTIQPPDPEDPNKDPESEPDPDTEPVEEPVIV